MGFFGSAEYDKDGKVIIKSNPLQDIARAICHTAAGAAGAALGGPVGGWQELLLQSLEWMPISKKKQIVKEQKQKDKRESVAEGKILRRNF